MTNGAPEIPGYRIEDVIGIGGMGTVYRSVDLRLERTVAVKVLNADLAADRGFRQRFTSESRLSASIDHPHVLPVYEAGEADGLLYIVMRFVEGSDLRELLATKGRMDAERAVRLIGQIADALDAAHARGLVHRDIKPANVLLTRPGERREHAYLTDFGLTKSVDAPGLTETGQFVGTLDYVAPEQCRGDQIDSRADVYSLGCVLFECLTGMTPFVGNSEVAKLYAHVNEPPPRPSASVSWLPQGFDEVIERAMAKAPAERPSSAGELAEEAAAVLASRSRSPIREPPRGRVEETFVPRIPVVPQRHSPGEPTRAEERTPVTPAASTSQPPAQSFEPSSGSRGGALLIAALIASAVILAGGGVAAAILLRDGGTQPAGDTGGPGKANTRTRPDSRGAANEPAGQRTPEECGSLRGTGTEASPQFINIEAENTTCDTARQTIASGPRPRASAGWECPVTGNDYYTECTMGGARISWSIPAGDEPAPTSASRSRSKECGSYRASDPRGGTMSVTDITTLDTSCEEARAMIDAGPAGRKRDGWGCPKTGNDFFTGCTRDNQRVSWAIPAGDG